MVGMGWVEMFKMMLLALCALFMVGQALVAFPDTCACPDPKPCPSFCLDCDAYNSSCISGKTHKKCNDKYAEDDLCPESYEKKPQTGARWSCSGGGSWNVMYHCQRDCLDVTTGKCDLCQDGYYGYNSNQTCKLCEAGSYCALGIRQGQCLPGYFCEAGSSSNTSDPCPAGSYAEYPGSVSPLCEGTCDPGYYCEKGSTTPTQYKCLPGFWGKFGETNRYCSGACSAGYYCPEGSSSPEQESCGDISVYCPEASESPIPVTKGYYSTPENDTMEETRTGQVICPKGHYCKDGKRYICPAGRYNPSLGESSCNLECEAGYFCAQGSQRPRGGGCYDTEEPPDHPAEFYCPKGTEFPIRVLEGYYTIPEDAPDDRREAQEYADPSVYVARFGKRLRRVEWRGICASEFAVISMTELTNGGTGDGSPGANVTVLDAFDNFFNKTLVTADTDRFRIAQTYSEVDSYYHYEGQYHEEDACTFPFHLEHNLIVVNSNASLDYEKCSNYSFWVVATSFDESTFSTCEITVTVENGNDIPYWGDRSSDEYPNGDPTTTVFHVTERAEPNSGVGPPMRIYDEDVGQELFFKILPTLDAGLNMFYIGSCSGQLYVLKQGLDYMVKRQYDLQIQVCDDKNFFDGVEQCSKVVNITIYVDDVNDAPRFRQDPYWVSSFRVPENSPKGALLTPYCTNTSSTIEYLCPANITGIVVDDLDFPEDHSSTLDVMQYEITRNSQNEFFAVVSCDRVNNLDTCYDEYIQDNANAGTLVVRKPDLNFEKEDTYSIGVKVDDGRGGFVGGDIIIHVIDVNDKPMWEETLNALKMKENDNSGVQDILASDEDENDMLTYEIANVWDQSGDLKSGIFTIDSTSVRESTPVPLALQSGVELNYETSSFYTLELKVTDVDGLSDTFNFTLNVIDVNEPPTITTDTLTIAENTPFGSVTSAMVSFEDVDFDQAGFFSILPEQDGELFGISSTTGKISVRTDLDYERGVNYTIVVAVSDTGVPSLTTHKSVTIMVSDIHEAPFFPAVKETFDFYESESINADFIEGITINDEDIGDVVTLSIVSQSAVSTGKPLDYFDIAANNLVQNSTSASLPNYESEVKRVHVEVLAEDLTGLKTTGSIYVDIKDVNDLPTLTPVNTSVSEHATGLEECTIERYCLPGLLVLEVFEFSKDEDIPDEERVTKLTYSIESGNVNSTFRLTDGVLYVNAITDGLRNPGYVFTLGITVSDDVGDRGPVFFVIEVTPRNFRPTIPDHAVDVDENTDPLVLITDTGAKDPDDVDAPLTYEIAQVIPSASFRNFRIDENNGTFYLEQPLDFETMTDNGVITVTIRVRDNPGQTDSQSATGRITITVNDMNESPTFSLGMYAYEMNEMDVADAIGVTVEALDVDAGDVMTYSLRPKVAQEGAVPFSINSATGEISHNTVLDFENPTPPCALDNGIHSCEFVVEVEDSGGYTAETELVVKVGNINEKPSVNLVTCIDTFAICEDSRTIRLKEDIYKSTPVKLGRISSIDPDTLENIRLSFAVASFSSNASHTFQVDSIGNVFLVERLDFENRSSYEFHVTVSDLGDSAQAPLNDTAKFTVHVDDVNDVGIARTNAATIWDTVGGDMVTLVGTNFGPTTFKIAQESAELPSVHAYLVQKGTGVQYNATNCAMVSSIMIVCNESPAGVGNDFYWQVELNGVDKSPLDFADPSLANRFKMPVISAVVNASAFPTKGGSTFSLLGSDFGALVSNPNIGIRVDYRSELSPTIVYTCPNNCNISTVEAQEAITCFSVPGSGTRLEFRVVVENQHSEWFRSSEDTIYSYAAPEILQPVSILDGGTSARMSTQGGSVFDALILQGENFGEETASIVVTYGPSGGNVNKFTAVNCTLTVPHEEIQCIYIAGTGINLVFTISADYVKAASPSPLPGLSYVGPTITSITGPGAEAARSDGGDAVYLSGYGFGPTTNQLIVSATYGGANATRYKAKNCAITQNDTEVTCFTSAGTGKGHGWKISISNQVSDIAFGSSYSPPTINYFGGKKADAVTDGGEVVTLLGMNFGYDSSLVTATFGPTGTEYDARSCQIDPEMLHTRMTCELPPGIGSELKWTVYVDGQASTVPTTDYKEPNIRSLGGNPARYRASTEGSEYIWIYGLNFGNKILHAPESFHHFSYGPITGKEYALSDCTIKDPPPTRVYTTTAFTEETQDIILSGDKVDEIQQIILNDDLSNIDQVVYASSRIGTTAEIQLVNITEPKLTKLISITHASTIQYHEEVQVLRFQTGLEPSGSFRLVIDTSLGFDNLADAWANSQTQAISIHATATQVKAALSELDQFSKYGERISVSLQKSDTIREWTISFPEEYGNLPALALVDVDLLDASGTPYLLSVQDGSFPAYAIQLGEHNHTGCIPFGSDSEALDAILETYGATVATALSPDEGVLIHAITYPNELKIRSCASLFECQDAESCQDEVLFNVSDSNLAGTFQLELDTTSGCKLCTVQGVHSTGHIQFGNASQVKEQLDALPNIIGEVQVMEVLLNSSATQEGVLYYIGFTSSMGNLPQLSVNNYLTGDAPMTSVSTILDGETPSVKYSFGSTNTQCLPWNMDPAEMASALVTQLGAQVSVTRVSNDTHMHYYVYRAGNTPIAVIFDDDECDAFAFPGNEIVSVATNKTDYHININTENCTLCDEIEINTTLSFNPMILESFQNVLDQALGQNTVRVFKVDKGIWNLTFTKGGNVPVNMLEFVSDAIGLDGNPVVEKFPDTLREGNQLAQDASFKLLNSDMIFSVSDSEEVFEYKLHQSGIIGLAHPVHATKSLLNDGLGGVKFNIVFRGNMGDYEQLACTNWTNTSLAHPGSPGTGLYCNVSTVVHGNEITGGNFSLLWKGDPAKRVEVTWDESASSLETKLRDISDGVELTVSREKRFGKYNDWHSWYGAYIWSIHTPTLPREDISIETNHSIVAERHDAQVAIYQPELGYSTARCKTVPGAGSNLRFVAKIANQESVLSAVTMSYKYPYISSLSPAIGTTGKDFRLTLNGYNFGAPPSALKVTYRGVKLTVEQHDHRKIVVIIPENIQRGFNQWIHVSVEGQSHYKRYSFGRPVVHSISAVNPPETLTGPPQDILIRGENFGVCQLTQDRVYVDDLDHECEILEWTHTTILCRLSKLSGKMRVSFHPLSCQSDEGSCCPCDFDYESLLRPPKVTSISNCSTLGIDTEECYTDGGYELSVYGEDLGTPIHGRVFIGDEPCVVSGTYTDTEVRCRVPPGEGVHSVYVYHAWKRSQHGIQFVYDSPVLHSVQPGAGNTKGGYNVTIKGNNFGVVGPTIAVGERDCHVYEFTHHEAVCLLPQGEGVVPISMRVASQTQKSAILFDYFIPSIANVEPNHGGTDGEYEITIHGENFGTQGSVWIGEETNECELTSYEHKIITCILPPGTGSHVRVTVVSGGRSSPEGEGALFHYDPPTIDSLSPNHGSTDGGTTLILVGQNFGASVQHVSISIGDSPCTDIKVVSSRRLECLSPLGFGVNRTLVLSVNGQIASQVVLFHYDAPIIMSMSPFPFDGRGTNVTGALLTILGKNFGNELVHPGAPDLEILVSKMLCEDAMRLNDQSLSCRMPEQLVGFHTVSVHVANQSVTLGDNEPNSLLVACTPGYFGKENDFCEPCPHGAECLGYVDGWHYEPSSLPGYGPLNRTYFQPCQPSHACTGNRTCLDGYEHKSSFLELCGKCSNDFYRLEGQCEPCPDLAWLILVGCFLVAALLCSLAYFLTKYGVQLAAMSICIDFCQVVSLFASYDFAWPTVVSGAYAFLSAFNLNLELASPECSVGWDYETKWYIMFLMPVVFGGLFALSFIFSFIRRNIQAFWRRTKAAVASRKSNKKGERIAPKRNVENKVLLVDDGDMESYDASFNRFIDAEFGAFLIMCYYLYLNVMRKCFETFRCTDDDVPLLRAEPSEPCTDQGTFYNTIHLLSKFGIVLFGVGMPLLIGRLLFKHRKFIKQDQERRRKALNISETEAALRLQSAYRGYYTRRVVDPRAILRRHKLLTNIGRTRAKYGKLYEDFTADCYYWRLVLMLRKVLLVMITMFLDDKFKQATLAFAVLFTSYALQVSKRPYLDRYPDDSKKRMQIKAYKEWKRKAEMRNEVQKTQGRLQLLQAGAAGLRKRINTQARLIRNLGDTEETNMKEHMDFRQLEVNSVAAAANEALRRSKMTDEEKQRDRITSSVERRWNKIKSFVIDAADQDKFKLTLSAADDMKTDAFRWLFDYNTLETISLATSMYILLFGLLFDTYKAHQDSVSINLLATITILLFVLVILLFLSSVMVDLKRKFFPVFKEKFAREGWRALTSCCRRSKKVAPQGRTFTNKDGVTELLEKRTRGQWVSPVNPFATLAKQNADLVKAEEMRLRAILASKERHSRELAEREEHKREEEARLEDEYKAKMESVEAELRELEQKEAEQEAALQKEIELEMAEKARAIEEEMKAEMEKLAQGNNNAAKIAEDEATRKKQQEEADRVLKESLQKSIEEQLEVEKKLIAAQAEAEKQKQLAELKAKHASEVTEAIEDLEKQAQEVFAGHRKQQEEIKARLQERKIRKTTAIRRRRPPPENEEEKLMQELEEKFALIQEKQMEEEARIQEAVELEKAKKLDEAKELVSNKVQKDYNDDSAFEEMLSREESEFNIETQRLVQALKAEEREALEKAGDDMTLVENIRTEYGNKMTELLKRRTDEREALRKKLDERRQQRLAQLQESEEQLIEKQQQLLVEASHAAREEELKAQEIAFAQGIASREEVDKLRETFEGATKELARKQDEERESRKVALEKRLAQRRKAAAIKKEQLEKKEAEEAKAKAQEDAARQQEEATNQLEQIKEEAREKTERLEKKLRDEKLAQREKVRERLAKKKKAAEAKKKKVLEEKAREQEEMQQKLQEEEAALRERQAEELHEIEEAKIEVFLDENQTQSLVDGVAAWRKRKEEQKAKNSSKAPQRSEMLADDFAAKAERIEKLTEQLKDAPPPTDDSTELTVISKNEKELKRLVKELSNLHLSFAEEIDAEIIKLSNEAAVEKARQKRKLDTLKELVSGKQASQAASSEKPPGMMNIRLGTAI